jgi:hypothetical protein
MAIVIEKYRSADRTRIATTGIAPKGKLAVKRMTRCATRFTTAPGETAREQRMFAGTRQSGILTVMMSDPNAIFAPPKSAGERPKVNRKKPERP